MEGGFDRNQEATCYVGDLDGQVDEAVLWELCVQVRAHARSQLARLGPTHPGDLTYLYVPRSAGPW